MFDAIFFSESYAQQLLLQIKKLEHVASEEKGKKRFFWLKLTILKQITILILRLKQRYHEVIARLKQTLWRQREEKEHFETLDKNWQQREQKRRDMAKSPTPSPRWAIPLLTPELYAALATKFETHVQRHYQRIQSVLRSRFLGEQIALHEQDTQLKKLTLKLSMAYRSEDTELIAELENQYRALREQKNMSSAEIQQHVETRVKYLSGNTEKNAVKQAERVIKQAAAVMAQINLLGRIKEQRNNDSELSVFGSLYFSNPKRALSPSLSPIAEKYRSKIKATLEQEAAQPLEPCVTAPLLWSKPQRYHELKPQLKRSFSASGG